MSIFKRKPFIISKEFVQQILESRQSKESREEIGQRVQEFEKNNLGNSIKVKMKK